MDSGGPGSKCKSEFMLEECPCSDEKLVEYVKELTENFKRSHQLKDILNESWFKTNPNSACNDTGNTLLHIATKLSQLKLVTGYFYWDQRIISLINPKCDKSLIIGFTTLITVSYCWSIEVSNLNKSNF